MSPRKAYGARTCEVATSAPAGLAACGTARPSLPVSVFGEDFSLLVRLRRLRIARAKIRVLS